MEPLDVPKTLLYHSQAPDIATVKGTEDRLHCKRYNGMRYNTGHNVQSPSTEQQAACQE
jgi:hypothetical protein